MPPMKNRWKRRKRTNKWNRNIQTAATHLLLHGNASVQLVAGQDGRPVELYALRPERVTVEARDLFRRPLLLPELERFDDKQLFVIRVKGDAMTGYADEGTLVVFDTEGRRSLDMMSAYSAVSLGHAHPDVIAAVTRRAADGMRFRPSSRRMFVPDATT